MGHTEILRFLMPCQLTIPTGWPGNRNHFLLCVCVYMSVLLKNYRERDCERYEGNVCDGPLETISAAVKCWALSECQVFIVIEWRRKHRPGKSAREPFPGASKSRLQNEKQKTFVKHLDCKRQSSEYEFAPPRVFRNAFCRIFIHHSGRKSALLTAASAAAALHQIGRARYYLWQVLFV